MNNWLQRIFSIASRKEKEAPPEDALATSIVENILSTRANEISCEECFVQLDQFAEMHLAHVNVTEALPLVQAHLSYCTDCYEEFELLLEALEATA